MKQSRILNSIALLILMSCCAGLAYAQSAERWFQVEVTVFSNESISDRERERWQAQRMQLAYPPDMIRLRQVTDLLFLEWFTQEPELEPETDIRSETETDTAGVDLARLRDTGPFPAGESSGFRFPDLQRDPFLALPASVSEFRQSNQVIEAGATAPRSVPRPVAAADGRCRCGNADSCCGRRPLWTALGIAGIRGGTFQSKPRPRGIPHESLAIGAWRLTR